jgi:hypothetical protein
LLHELAQFAAERVAEQKPSRLLCLADALPIGLAVSLYMQIPLVYSATKHGAPATTLIGAYDIGHSAVLLMNTSASLPEALKLQQVAEQVGISVVQKLAILDLGNHQDVQSLLHLPDLVAELAHDGAIPHGQAQAVLHWVMKQSIRPDQD